MNDVAPALKARVQKAFRDGLEQQAALKGLSEKNSPDYTDARAYGETVGGELAEAFKQISGDDLPNGHMYYNIAEKVVVPLIDEAYAMAADYCEKTQNALNEKAGLGIKAVRPELDPERTDSIVNKLDATEKFEDAKWILDDAVQNVVSSASDTSIKANAEAQYRAGLRPKVTRDSGGKCCDWCAALDGVYYYPDVPKEVYARHNNCTCSVEYSPSEGRRQDVWSKKWQGDAEPAAILSRAEAAKANEAARDARDAEQRAERAAADKKTRALQGVNYARGVNWLYADDMDHRYTIEEIVQDLQTSVVGRDAISYIQNGPVSVSFVDEKQIFPDRGEQFGKQIKIYLANCDNVKIAAQTVVHEATHARYKIGRSQLAEAMCYSMELMHIRNRDYIKPKEWEWMTEIAEKQYPDYPKEKGEYETFKRFRERYFKEE